MRKYLSSYLLKKSDQNYTEFCFLTNWLQFFMLSLQSDALAKPCECSQILAQDANNVSAATNID